MSPKKIVSKLSNTDNRVLRAPAKLIRRPAALVSTLVIASIGTYLLLFTHAAVPSHCVQVAGAADGQGICDITQASKADDAVVSTYSETDALAAQGWVNWGTIFKAPNYTKNGALPVYRFYYPGISAHFVLIQGSADYNTAVADPTHYHNEGLAFYAWPDGREPGTVPIERIDRGPSYFASLYFDNRAQPDSIKAGDSSYSYHEGINGASHFYAYPKNYEVPLPVPPGCSYTAPVKANQWGAMGYVNYTYNLSDINSITGEIDVLNSPKTNSDFYIQVYDSNIGASGQYFGIQTTGTVIWSRFGTRDQSNIRSGGGATVLDSNAEGDFISLRRSYGSLPQGKYIVRITRAEFDGIGDWFNYYVTFPGKTEDYIGAMRFPRENANVPAAFHDGGGQWNEFWDNNGANLNPVPQLQLNVKVTANNGIVAATAKGHYSPMPNSDMYAISSGGFVHHEMGSTTPRCHFGDSNNDLNLWKNISQYPNSSSPTVNVTSSTTSTTAPGNFTLTANAADPDGISKVEFYSNNVLMGSDTTAPYTFQATNVSAGSYTIVAKATDKHTSPATGSSSPITVTVTSPPVANNPPTVSLNISPSSASPPATIALSATAADSDGTISKVEFYNGSTLVAQDTTAPYNATLSNLNAGTYNLTAKASDNKGAVSTSTNVAVNVTNTTPGNDTIRPTTPTNLNAGTPVFDWGYKMPFSWTPSTDNSGSVAYMVSLNGSSPIKISQNYYTIPVNSGASYRLTVYAIDPTGNPSASISKTATPSCFLFWCSVQ